MTTSPLQSQGRASTRRLIKLPFKLQWEDLGAHIAIGIEIHGVFVTDPFKDESSVESVDPMEAWGLTQEQAQFIVDINKELDEAVEAAINEACYMLQNFVGIDAGDYAGVHFSGSARKNRIKEVFAEYIVDDFNFSSPDD